MSLSLLFVFLCISLPCSLSAVVQFDDWPHGRVQLEDVSIHFRYAGNGPPLLLVHGNPEHSLTWRIVGPILAEQYTVIAADNRGMGDSSIPANNVYTSEAMGSDLKGLLDFLKINETFVFAHDKGCGAAAALTAQNRELVKAIGFAEYGLPGFGYETFWTPSPNWDLYQNWQLAWFAIPDAAEYFIRDHEKQMLSWYFFHASYSGTTIIPEDILDRYTSSISKPGFLRAMLGPFATTTVAADNQFFNDTIRNNPLEMPILATGGEASLGATSLLKEVWGPIGKNVQYATIPKAGHWIADENGPYVAELIQTFLANTTETIAATNLSWLSNIVTLQSL